ncbi:MAG TPA: glutathione S-transferase family protein [Candidatus Margulisiibacteriota bacterium]|nr:glutathione S-transferase family protein [Candidatus Margulisiibacteriota bacterium]
MLKLYHSPRTRSVRIYWLLEELGVSYQLETLAFTPETLKTAAYLKVHPLGKLPAIQDGDLVMFESGAILEYVLETYGNGRLAPAPGSPARGAFLQWVHFAEATAMPPLADIAQHMLFKPEAERLPAVVADGQARVNAVLAALEIALTGKQYLLGSEFTGADIMMGYALLLVKWFGLLTQQYPNVTAYLARLEQRPALQKALS